MDIRCIDIYFAAITLLGTYVRCDGNKWVTNG